MPVTGVDGSVGPADCCANESVIVQESLPVFGPHRLPSPDGTQFTGAGRSLYVSHPNPGHGHRRASRPYDFCGRYVSRFPLLARPSLQFLRGLPDSAPTGCIRHRFRYDGFNVSPNVLSHNVSFPVFAERKHEATWSGLTGRTGQTAHSPYNRDRFGDILSNKNWEVTQ